MNNLTKQHCTSCEGGMDPMPLDTAKTLLAQLDDWKLNETATIISKKFDFKGFNKTMGFVNAIAWLVNKEGHHPDLYVTFNSCTVNFTTHAIGGLSENDFICAAKIDILLT